MLATKRQTSEYHSPLPCGTEIKEGPFLRRKQSTRHTQASVYMCPYEIEGTYKRNRESTFFWRKMIDLLF